MNQLLSLHFQVFTIKEKNDIKILGKVFLSQRMFVAKILPNLLTNVL